MGEAGFAITNFCNKSCIFQQVYVCVPVCLYKKDKYIRNKIKMQIFLNVYIFFSKLYEIFILLMTADSNEQGGCQAGCALK